MKKLFLSLLLMFLPILASSQTYIKMINNNNLYQIPKDLCLLNHKYFFDSKEDISRKIYDEKYDLVKEFNSLSFLPKYNFIRKTEKRDFASGDWIIEDDASAEKYLFLNYQYENYYGQSYVQCPFSQTLFSDDEKFEFYVPFDVNIEYPIVEYDENGDGIIDKREYFTSIECSGINVISEDGVVLATFRAEGFKFVDDWVGAIKFIRVDNILYAIILTTDKDNPYAMYKLDKEWSSASNPIQVYKDGDVNKDGKVNVADHVKLSDIIMNK